MRSQGNAVACALWLVVVIVLSFAVLDSAAAQVPPSVEPTRIDLNAADESALMDLPGIGPARAIAIIELRTRLGAFRRVEELLRVRGIGRATFRRLRARVFVVARANVPMSVLRRARPP